MDITKDMMHQALMVAAPCKCEAPIAYTCQYWTDDMEQNTTKAGTELFNIDLSAGVVESVYNDIPKGADQDDLCLRCVKCGADWTPFNPIFTF